MMNPLPEDDFKELDNYKNINEHIKICKNVDKYDWENPDKNRNL